MSYARHPLEAPPVALPLTGSSLTGSHLPALVNARANVTPLDIEVVTTRAAFDALEPEWQALSQRSGNGRQVFQTFGWNWHWANHYLEPAPGQRATCSLAIVAVRRHGTLVALWPLVIVRIAGLKVLQWMGDPVSQYGDILVEDGPGKDDIIARSWHTVTTALGADAIFLRKVRADAEVAPVLRTSGFLQTAAAEAPYLDIGSAADFEAYEQRYSSKVRKNRRRLMRRLCDQGPVSINHHTGGPAARAAAIDAIALKRRWLANTGKVSLALSGERFSAFFADVAQGKGRDAGCELTVLTCNGETAAATIEIGAGRHRTLHVLVHDAKFDTCGAGMLAIQESARQASADGVATFDMLAPAHVYKRDWADGAVAIGDYALGLTLPGRAYTRAYLGFARERIKAGVEALAGVIANIRAARARILPRWLGRATGTAAPCMLAVQPPQLDALRLLLSL